MRIHDADPHPHQYTDVRPLENEGQRTEDNQSDEDVSHGSNRFSSGKSNPLCRGKKLTEKTKTPEANRLKKLPKIASAGIIAPTANNLHETNKLLADAMFIE
jgi:hypothetical protein